jgi:hypothetical protein
VKGREGSRYKAENVLMMIIMEMMVMMLVMMPCPRV